MTVFATLLYTSTHEIRTLLCASSPLKKVPLFNSDAAQPRIVYCSSIPRGFFFSHPAGKSQEYLSVVNTFTHNQPYMNTGILFLASREHTLLAQLGKMNVNDYLFFTQVNKQPAEHTDEEAF